MSRETSDVGQTGGQIKPLYAGLFVTYFGDYCSLIGLMEFAKRFGQSDKVVWIFVVYSLPPLFMILGANRWLRSQISPSRQLVGFSMLGAFCALSLFVADTFLHVILVSFLLGVVKQAGRTLLNVYVKHQFEVNRAKEVLNNVVSIRYFIMVFGGSLGAYLGGQGLFNWVFTIDLLSFLVAASCFWKLNDARPTEIQDPMGSESNQSHLQGLQRLVRDYGSVPYLWTSLSLLCLGLFMAVEYPLITTELGISPSLIGFIWGGHVVGTLCARRFSRYLLSRFTDLGPLLRVGSVALLIGFGTFGLFGSHLALVTFQMAVAVCFMAMMEVLAGAHLIAVSDSQVFARSNLYFRIGDMIYHLVASAIPLVALSYFSLKQINAGFAAILFVVGWTVEAGLRMVSKRGVCGTAF